VQRRQGVSRSLPASCVLGIDSNRLAGGDNDGGTRRDGGALEKRALLLFAAMRAPPPVRNLAPGLDEDQACRQRAGSHSLAPVIAEALARRPSDLRVVQGGRAIVAQRRHLLSALRVRRREPRVARAGAKA